jgi:hypothetical protein
VTAFPQALSAWRRRLALLDPAVLEALAPMLDRLARAIGPMAPEASEADGEPSGYDGVATRGAYERLLPSEWLLAEEVPEEFLRRAVMREHLFFALARERPRGRRSLTVVVDAGPELFGTPRIGALAALLVLAQRAEAGGATFGWRPAQTSGTDLVDLQPVGLRSFLDTVTTAPLGADLLRDAVEQARERSELWVVAGERGARAAESLGASTIAIDDVLDPRARELAVRVRVPQRSDRTARLPLPDDPTCVRVLRDPFPHRALPGVRRVGVRAPLAIARPVVSPTAGHPSVFARLEDGALLVVALPRSKRQDIGEGRVLRLEGAGEIVAAGHVRGKPAVIAQSDYDLTLAVWRNRRSVSRRLGRCTEMLRPPPLDRRIFPLAAVGGTIFFVGRGGRLLEFRPGNRARVVVLECTALVADGADLVFAVGGDPTTGIRTLRAQRGEDDVWLWVPADNVLLARTEQGAIACAYDGRDGRWVAASVDPRRLGKIGALEDLPRVVPIDGDVRVDPARPMRLVFGVPIEIPGSAEVVGVFDQPARHALHPLGRGDAFGPVVKGRIAALLVLEDDGRRLRATSGVTGEGEFTVDLPERAEHVVLDPVTRVAACVTATAELILVALDWRAVFARFTSRGRVA